MLDALQNIRGQEHSPEVQNAEKAVKVAIAVLSDLICQGSGGSPGRARGNRFAYDGI